MKTDSIRHFYACAVSLEERSGHCSFSSQSSRLQAKSKTRAMSPENYRSLRDKRNLVLMKKTRLLLWKKDRLIINEIFNKTRAIS